MGFYPSNRKPKTEVTKNSSSWSQSHTFRSGTEATHHSFKLAGTCLSPDIGEYNLLSPTQAVSSALGPIYISDSGPSGSIQITVSVTTFLPSLMICFPSSCYLDTYLTSSTGHTKPQRTGSTCWVNPPLVVAAQRLLTVPYARDAESISLIH